MPTITLLPGYTPDELAILRRSAARRGLTIEEAEAAMAKERLAQLPDVQLDKDGNVIFLEQAQ